MGSGLVLEPEVVSLPSIEAATFSLIFSAFALAIALLAVALSLRTASQAQANAQGEDLEPRPRPVLTDEEDGGAWHGNVEEGYTRGPFVVKLMPTRGPKATRGNETEWVAYANGERVANSQNLAEVLGWCEGQE